MGVTWVLSGGPSVSVPEAEELFRRLGAVREPHPLLVKAEPFFPVGESSGVMSAFQVRLRSLSAETCS